MKNQLYIILLLFCANIAFGQKQIEKEINPFYLYYRASGSTGITNTIEIKNNGTIKLKVEGAVQNDKVLRKTIKMDKRSFELFKSNLVNRYKILELPTKDLSCKLCADGATVELKFKILNVTRDIVANNPSSANEIFKDVEEYINEVIGRLDI